MVVKCIKKVQYVLFLNCIIKEYDFVLDSEVLCGFKTGLLTSL